MLRQICPPSLEIKLILTDELYEHARAHIEVLAIYITAVINLNLADLRHYISQDLLEGHKLIIIKYKTLPSSSVDFRLTLKMKLESYILNVR